MNPRSPTRNLAMKIARTPCAATSRSPHSRRAAGNTRSPHCVRRARPRSSRPTRDENASPIMTASQAAATAPASGACPRHTYYPAPTGSSVPRRGELNSPRERSASVAAESLALRGSTSFVKDRIRARSRGIARADWAIGLAEARGPLAERPVGRLNRFAGFAQGRVSQASRLTGFAQGRVSQASRLTGFAQGRVSQASRLTGFAERLGCFAERVVPRVSAPSERSAPPNLRATAREPSRLVLPWSCPSLALVWLPHDRPAPDHDRDPRPRLAHRPEPTAEAERVQRAHAGRARRRLH